MEHRNLGPSGLQVSLVGLGCNNFGLRIDLEQSRRVVHRAIDAGITLFDTSDVYGDPKGTSESILGEVLGPRRKDIVLATKFGSPMGEGPLRRGGSRRYVISAVEDSLRRLRTDWIDLYQQHRAPEPGTPDEETLGALDDLIRQGKVRYIGCCNRSAWQVVQAQWTARANGLDGFVSCQDEYSLLVRRHEQELIPAMQAHGLGLLPYFPLASGLLTGKYRRDAPPPEGSRLATTRLYADRYMTERNWGIVERLGDFCAARGRSLLELAFSWLAAKPPVASIIAGATRPEQIDANIAAAGWALGPDELTEVDRLTAAEPGR